MIKKIPAEDRHYADHGWLKTYWLFSFGDYFDPHNMEFGSLRVFNDDVVMPHSGFPDHPHQKMEIVTIVKEGTLTHTDSTGTSATIGAGEMQRMSAGKGIIHSEYNDHDTPVHLYQLWFYPNEDTEAGYEQKKIEYGDSPFTVIASPYEDSLIHLRADAVISELHLSQNSYALSLKDGWGCFVYVEEGVLSLKGEEYVKGDQIRSIAEKEIIFSTSSEVRALVIEVKV